MCRDLPAVALARMAGENVDETVCGGRKGRCPFFDQCGYQRQRDPVASADVVIGAHELAFHPPATVKKGLALTVMDESWWQDGLDPGRAIAVDGLADSVMQHPVWHRGVKGGPQRENAEGSSDLHAIRAALQRALDASPDGYLRREHLVAAGLTPEKCASARKLEWDRKREGLMRPGMSFEARKKAAEEAGINAQVPRFAIMWGVLSDLISSGGEATGRAELEWRTTPEGDRRVLALNTKRNVSDAIVEGPVLLLDATMPVDLVRTYLPGLETAPAVRVKAPYMRLHQVVGGFGKTSIIPHGDPETAENRRRRNLAAELRDLIENEARGAAGLVVTYEALEPAFQGIAGVATAHFNAVAGHDQWRDVRNLFLIGRPLPAPYAIRQLAAALTGEPVEVSESHREARAVRLADGTGGTVEVRAYADPRAEAVRAAITDAEVVQGIGRARGVNRTAANPVRVWLMADVVTPLVVDRLTHWRDLAPSTVKRMALRGRFLASPADSAKAYPDLFPTPKAAEHALKRAGIDPRGISPPTPYERILIGEWGGNTPLAFTYRPEGRGQQFRRGWARPGTDPVELWEWLRDLVGELALFMVDGEGAEPDPDSPPDHAPPDRPSRAEPCPVHGEAMEAGGADHPLGSGDYRHRAELIPADHGRSPGLDEPWESRVEQREPNPGRPPPRPPWTLPASGTGLP